jgi:hypothetical protein
MGPGPVTRKGTSAAYRNEAMHKWIMGGRVFIICSDMLSKRTIGEKYYESIGQDSSSFIVVQCFSTTVYSTVHRGLDPKHAM